VYLAPKVCGGAEAKSPVAGAGVQKMADALELGHPMVERLGDDLKITYLRKDPAAEGGF
jgi:diaminohydroxyphosphoribosylaminopyrimidine deaminase/5-amino-6-(5-phosphoribosylamino)uracil reductase